MTLNQDSARGIELRPLTDDDEELSYRVYAETRTEELAPLGWDEATREAFLRMQHAAQRRHYLTHFGDASFQVILFRGEPAGRLYVGRWDQEIHLIDIALLPEHRGAGIGSYLIQGLLDEAAAAGKPVRIHVEQFNRALGLYERLGFRKIGENGIYWLMEWSPPTRQAG